MKWVMFVTTLLALCTAVCLAGPQMEHRSGFKVVGQVLDGSGRPINYGRVYVKDARAHFLRIKPVDRGGHFNSGLLDARLDYEVYAEQDDLLSKKVIISGPKKTPEVVIRLKLSKKQEIH